MGHADKPGMVRVLEVLVGLGLACSGLGSLVSVITGIAAWGLDIGVVVSAICGALMLLLAWRLIRGPRSSRASGRRWIPLATGGFLLLLLFGIVYPNFVDFSRRRSVLSEPRLVLGEISTAEESYFGEFGEYLALEPFPKGPPSSIPVEQIETPAEAKTLGWSFEPGRAVYCRYGVAVGSFATAGRGAQAFTAEAICDIDGDGAFMAWGYVRPDRESSEAIPGPFERCPAEGALDRSTWQRRPAVVGPCDEKSGSEVF